MKWSAAGTVCLAFSFLAGSSGLAAEKREPLAKGNYDILLGGRRIGEEGFTFFLEKDKVVVESIATMYWPEPTRHQYRQELVSSFQTVKLNFTLTRSGVTTSLELEPHRDQWRLEITGEGRKKVRQELGRQVGTEIDFGSLLFKSIILKRLSLKPGDERSVEAIALLLPDLNGKRNSQTYRRLEDEELETKPMGTVAASAYELETSDSLHKLWTDQAGWVLRARFDSPVGPFEYELVRLDSHWTFTPPR